MKLHIFIDQTYYLDNSLLIEGYHGRNFDAGIL
jgi:hypothetical protein